MRPIHSTPRLLLAFVIATVACVAGAEPLKSEVFARAGTFEQEIGAAYHVADGLPSDDVLSVAVGADSSVYAGTAAGLARLDGGVWKAVEPFGSGPVLVAAAPGGIVPGAYSRTGLEWTRGSALSEAAVLVIHDGALHSIDGARICALPPGSSAVGDITAFEVSHAVLLGSDEGLHVLSPGGSEGAFAFAPVADLYVLLGNDKTVNAISIGAEGGVAVGAASGLFVLEGQRAWSQEFPRSSTRSWAPVDVRGVAFDAAGRLWFASPQGVGCFENGAWKLYEGRDGLPLNDFTLAAAGEEGAIWFGTRQGALRFDGAHWGYREGRRWLPDNEVRGIAVTPEGHAYFATAGGMGFIERRPMTLAEKAKYFEGEIEKYHLRTPYGYVLSASLARPGDLSEWINHDSDNDGLYTGVYGAGQSLAYAVTGDPEAKARAKRSLRALAFLSEVTQGGEHPAPHGFVARTILPTSGPDPNEGRIARDIKKKAEDDALWKTIDPRWPVSADGEWYWKSDTSSDELDGHFFFYGIYYDHVAETGEEKAEIREVVDRVAGHLVDHDFQLVDHDGLPTRWARFGPHDLNDSRYWWAERGLNSMSILAHLNVAAHVTGNPKYREAIDRLVSEHNYAMNALQSPKLQAGPGSFVQFDDIMAFMNYYHLLKYEQDPEILQMIRESIFYYWRNERYEMNPVFNFIYAASCLGQSYTDQWGVHDVSPTGSWLEDSMDTLLRYPYNLINWRMTNSHRIDIVTLPEQVREAGANIGHGGGVDGKVLPIDERYLSKWGDDVWRLDTGGNGKELNDGSPYLLAYYLGRYHGFIVE